MKTTTLTTIGMCNIPCVNNLFSNAISLVFSGNTQASNSIGRILILGFLVMLSAMIYAQSFVEISGIPSDGISSGPVSFADIDNDTDLDVFIGSDLYTNDGTGLFEGGLWSPFTGLHIIAIAFADIDNDNDKDVFVSWSEPNGWNPQPSYYTSLYINNGSGTFLESVPSPFKATGYGAIACADVDNDNDQDVIITGFMHAGEWAPENPHTTLYLNNGSGGFDESTDNNFTDVGFSAIAFADIDNDNDQDVLITGMNNSWDLSSKLYTNDGNGLFEEVSETPFEGIRRGSIEFVDINNDNDLDVFIAGSNDAGEGTAKLYTNDGSGSFTELSTTTFDGVLSGSIAFSDIDNDNDQDLLITGLQGQAPGISSVAQLYINIENGLFVKVEGTPFEGVHKSSIAFADIDNDSDEDLLISGLNNSGQFITKLYSNSFVTTSVPKQNKVFQDIAIYPNPNRGNITVNLGELTDASIHVYTVGGQLVYKQDNITNPIYQFDLDTKAGIYILEISTQLEKQQYKLIKE